MEENLIHFKNQEWETPKTGVKQKVCLFGENRMRLVKFSDDFIEEHWCLNGHLGYVLKGEMNIDFNGTIKRYKKGDGLWIEKGESSKHKVIIEKGKEVKLILFESAEQ